MALISMRGKRGFTLIELLIYIATVVFIIGAVGSLLIWSIRLQTKAKIQEELIRNGDRAMSVMLRTTQEAQAIYTPTGLLNSPAGQLSLQMRPSAQGEEYSYIDFFLCEARVCFKKEGQEPIVLTTENIEINNLTFLLIGSGDFPSLQITLGMRYKSDAARPEYKAFLTLQSSASVRALSR